jgi:U3 small nucleolar RNA-associated protein 24
MGTARKTRKFAQVKRILRKKDLPTVKKQDEIKKVEKANSEAKRIAEKPPAHLFFKYNTSLGPPYHVLIDTNFINMLIQNRLEMVTAMMDCLLAKCIPCVTDCVMAELEKLGSKFRIALRIAKDPRVKRLPCTHKGIYADDCLVERAKAHKCYIVATCDRDLKRRLRKIPGVPIMYIHSRKCTIERLPDAYGLEKQ